MTPTDSVLLWHLPTRGSFGSSRYPQDLITLIFPSTKDSAQIGFYARGKCA